MEQMNTYEEKKEQLKSIVREYADGVIAIAFSGGVDSSLLLKLAVEEARELGGTVYGVLMRTMLHPMGEMEEAAATAKEIGAQFRVITVNELESADVLDNPVDRCYRCKKYLFEQAIKAGTELGAKVIMDGTNEDDLHVYRPGIRALKELGILSPLAKVGMTKAEVRKLAAELGISVSSKPSMPCLATRFPYGTKLSYEEMHKVEEGEEMIRALGFYNVRIRIHDGIARIEVDADDLKNFLDYREQVVKIVKELGYDYVTLDLEGFRSGSMDIHVKKEA